MHGRNIDTEKNIEPYKKHSRNTVSEDTHTHTYKHIHICTYIYKYTYMSA